jgi:hypothetical protein
LTFAGGSRRVIAKRVILALPKAPLEKIVESSADHFPASVRDAIDSTLGFPMVKVFLIVKNRWWEGNRANYYATRVPTREIHYWKSRIPQSTRGMIMVYTDRPGSAFWANYLIDRGKQDKPEWESTKVALNRKTGSERSSPGFQVSQSKRLLRKIVQYLHENGVESAHADDIEYYGIRDGAVHPT